MQAAGATTRGALHEDREMTGDAILAVITGPDRAIREVDKADWIAFYSYGAGKARNPQRDGASFRNIDSRPRKRDLCCM